MLEEEKLLKKYQKSSKNVFKKKKIAGKVAFYFNGIGKLRDIMPNIPEIIIIAK